MTDTTQNTKKHTATGNQRPPRTRRRRLMTWRRFLAACLIVPIAIVAALAMIPTTRWVRATGYVMTDLEAELRPSVQGDIAERLVNSGDVVVKGQPIIRLNDQVETAAFDQAASQLQAKQAQLKLLLSSQSVEKAQRKEQAYQAQQSLTLAQANLDRITQGNASTSIWLAMTVSRVSCNSLSLLRASSTLRRASRRSRRVVRTSGASRLT